MRYGEDIAHLNLLAVDPAHRRRGVARQLIRWLEETAVTAGTFVIGLELRATNESALQFYTKLWVIASSIGCPATTRESSRQSACRATCGRPAALERPPDAR